MLLTITSDNNAINMIEKAHKMSVVYFQGGAVKDHWKLMNNLFRRKITQFTLIDSNFKRKRNNDEKNTHKMSVSRQMRRT